jgi:predicted phage tail protein
MKVTLKLYGYLAEKYGSSLEFDAATPREAIMALAYQDPHYKKYIHDRTWCVFIGDKDNISEEMVDILLRDGDEVHLYPVIEGSNSSEWLSGVGTVLYITGQILTAVGVTAWIGVPLMIVGGIMMGVGVAGMMKRMQEGVSDDNDKFKSFVFSGPQNVTSQGGAIPVGYGRLRIGSTLISVGLQAEQIKIPKNSVFDALVGVTP